MLRQQLRTSFSTGIIMIALSPRLHEQIVIVGCSNPGWRLLLGLEASFHPNIYFIQHNQIIAACYDIYQVLRN